MALALGLFRLSIRYVIASLWRLFLETVAVGLATVNTTGTRALLWRGWSRNHLWKPHRTGQRESVKRIGAGSRRWRFSISHKPYSSTAVSTNLPFDSASGMRNPAMNITVWTIISATTFFWTRSRIRSYVRVRVRPDRTISPSVCSTT